MTARILVVDDSPDVLYASLRTLRRDGHTVVTAQSVQEAEQVWRQGRPDLVLLDVNLPDGNGIATSHRWKAMPERAGVPVILRSAVSVSAAEQTVGLRSGADGYLIDPVEPEVLSATVAAHLRISDLVGDLERSSRSADDLVRYSIELAQASAPEHVTKLLTTEATRSLGACETYLVWRRSGGVARHRRRSPGAPEGSVLAGLAALPGDGPRFYPSAATLPEGTGVPPSGQQAWAVLPFDDIEISGVLALAFDQTGPVHPERQRFLRTFVSMTALSLGRAGALDLYRSISATLQHALIPTPTLLPGVAVHRRLMVAEGATIAGGDWFDGYPLPSGDQALVCGDVVGHGAEAAGASSVFRDTLRTLLLTGTPVDRAIAETNRLVNSHSAHPRGTVLVARIDPAARRAHLHSAGHVPPVLIAPDGTAAPVDVRPTPPLGMGLATPPPVATTVELPPGSMLLLLTDGVVEHRDCDLDDGYARLCAHLRAARREPAAILAAVDDLLRTTPPTDDALFALVDLG